MLLYSGKSHQIIFQTVAMEAGLRFFKMSLGLGGDRSVRPDFGFFSQIFFSQSRNLAMSRQTDGCFAPFLNIDKCVEWEKNLQTLQQLVVVATLMMLLQTGIHKRPFGFFLVRVPC